jgi:hypothetical protein
MHYGECQGVFHTGPRSLWACLLPRSLWACPLPRSVRPSAPALHPSAPQPAQPTSPLRRASFGHPVDDAVACARVDGRARVDHADIGEVQVLRVGEQVRHQRPRDGVAAVVHGPRPARAAVRTALEPVVARVGGRRRMRFGRALRPRVGRPIPLASLLPAKCAGPSFLARDHPRRSRSVKDTTRMVLVLHGTNDAERLHFF